MFHKAQKIFKHLNLQKNDTKLSTEYLALKKN